MKYIRNTVDFQIEEDTVISLGKFDGIHRGHELLMERLAEKKREGLKAAIFTFDIPPRRNVQHVEAKVLTTNEEKMHIFEEMGIDYLIECPFTEEVMHMEPEDFIRMLVERLHVKCIVAGEDFRFGHNRRGDYRMLQEYAGKLGYEALIGRLNYSYDDRYLFEAQFRYDGSSKFATGHQWGFFPSVSAGWRVSREPFFKNCAALNFINQLKIRASYGELGDDSGLNYEWVTGYIYPATSGNAENGYFNQYAPGYMLNGSFVFGVNNQPLPNTNITWYTSKTFNVGVDFEAWNGMLGISFDYFHRKRTGLFGQRSSDVPTIIGASPSKENVNSDSHMGLELQLTHKNHIGEFTYGITGIAAVTRQKYLTYVENGGYGNSYDRWRHDNMNNRYQGVQFGYTGDGRFTSWEDIWSYGIYHESSTLPGDYKYEDWNGDGEINDLDEHPYAFDQTPWMNYSLAFDFGWKGIDLSILFQGSALGSMAYKEPLYSIWGSNGGGTLKQYLDRWHPSDPSADPYSPQTDWISGYYGYTGHYPSENSSFNRVSTAYLRLKSIELGYTFPTINWAKSLNLRVFFNAYNPLTFTKVKFVDPEHPDSDLGRMYPLNKTYTFGLNLSF